MLEWELITKREIPGGHESTFRLQVYRGWLVRINAWSTWGHGTNDFSLPIFVEDVDHRWTIDKEPKNS